MRKFETKFEKNRKKLALEENLFKGQLEKSSKNVGVSQCPPHDDAGSETPGRVVIKGAPVPSR